MSKSTDPKQNNIEQTGSNRETGETSAAEKKQQQSDPNITELKGLTDPDEELEVEGTDNDV